MKIAAVWEAAKIAARLTGVALRERQRRIFQKWNRSLRDGTDETGKKPDAK